MTHSAPFRLISLFQSREGDVSLLERLSSRLIERGVAERACRGGELMRDSQDDTQYVLSFDFDSEEQMRGFLDAEWRHEILRELPDLLELDVRRHVLEHVTSKTLA